MRCFGKVTTRLFHAKLFSWPLVQLLYKNVVNEVLKEKFELVER